MKFLIAPDSYKESISAFCAAKTIERGIKKVFPEAQCELIPMADGGEGTAECLMYTQKGEKITCQICNPFGEKINADFVWIEKQKTAVIEVAKACGIMLIPYEKRNPFLATSYGVGELIKEALKKGCKEIILTLGGTVTNDGGCGMLQALGAKILDKEKNAVSFGGKGLSTIDFIDLSETKKLLSQVKITVLCDVKNQLLGKNGATYIFGPQKGAKEKDLPLLEKAMSQYATLLDKAAKKEVSKMEGAGAAGGLGSALFAISDACFVSGSHYIMQISGLVQKIKECDYVITGEGAIDSQSLQGKVPISVAKLAKQYNIPVVVFAGKISGNIDTFYENGVSAVFCILQGIKPMHQVLKEAEKNLELTVENFARILKYAR